MNVNGWILSEKEESEFKLENDALKILLLAHARRKNITMTVIRPMDVELSVPERKEGKITVSNREEKLPDFVWVRLDSKKYDHKAYALLRALEYLGCCVLNNVQSIIETKDKFHTYQLMAKHKVPFPKTLYLDQSTDFERVQKELGFPVVLKGVEGEGGESVYLCENLKDLKNKINEMRAVDKTADLLLQEYIKESHGRSLRVHVIGGKAINVIEFRAQNDIMQSNQALGGKAHTYKMNEEIKNISKKVAEILNLDWAAVDLLLTKKHNMVCEINAVNISLRSLQDDERKHVINGLIEHTLEQVKASKQSA